MLCTIPVVQVSRSCRLFDEEKPGSYMLNRDSQDQHQQEGPVVLHESTVTVRHQFIKQPSKYRRDLSSREPFRKVHV